MLDTRHSIFEKVRCQKPASMKGRIERFSKASRRFATGSYSFSWHHAGPQSKRLGIVDFRLITMKQDFETSHPRNRENMWSLVYRKLCSVKTCQKRRPQKFSRAYTGEKTSNPGLILYTGKVQDPPAEHPVGGAGLPEDLWRAAGSGACTAVSQLLGLDREHRIRLAGLSRKMNLVFDGLKCLQRPFLWAIRFRIVEENVSDVRQEITRGRHGRLS
jgi:hypothetical protein